MPVPDEAGVIAAIEAPGPVPETILAALEAEITKFDCEEWSAEIGRAIIARLRREAKP